MSLNAAAHHAAHINVLFEVKTHIVTYTHTHTKSLEVPLIASYFASKETPGILHSMLTHKSFKHKKRHLTQETSQCFVCTYR